MNSQNGRISENNLMVALAKSKMVMDKVDNGDYSAANRDFVGYDDYDDYDTPEVNQYPKAKTTPIINEEKIRNSKLPEEIKRVMIENPIPQISLNNDVDIINGAKKLMERQGTIKPKNKQPQPINMDSNLLSNLIENIVRKVMDEKLNQILAAQQNMTINENLMIKVGDSVFKGKITGVNKSK